MILLVYFYIYTHMGLVFFPFFHQENMNKLVLVMEFTHGV